MKIILVEFPWQAREISENRELQNYVIVSVDPEASYILKKNKCKYYEIDEICNHEELWARYKNITESSLKITKILDKHLWNLDKRFRDLRWNFFDDFHYIFKTSYETLYYYVELISRLEKKFDPEQIILAETKDMSLDNDMLLDPNKSLFKFLFQNLSENKSKIQIKYMKANSEIIINDSNKNFFDKKLLKEKLKNYFYKFSFYFDYFFKKPKYFSVNCYEVIKFKSLYPKDSNKFICYNHGNTNLTKSKKNWKYFEDFCMNLENDIEFKELSIFKNTNFNNLFFEIVLQLSKRFESFLNEYSKVRKLINKIKPECLIFSSMIPFDGSNVIFRKICNDLNLPYALWVHGGFNQFSLPGLDVTDFRFCKNHISYGIHLSETIKDERCILNKLDLPKNFKVYPIGSPRFDYFLNKKKIKRNLKMNNKSTVLFAIGCLEIRNQFYFGYNRKKSFNMQWELHYQVIKLLKKYQNKYNIIVKDFPQGYPVGRNLWKSVLNDIGANNISYVSKESSLTDLFKVSDLNILTSSSTPFFESLYCDADIFLIEEDIDINLYRKKLENELFCYDNVKEYMIELEKYLELGKFYNRKKTTSRNYFVNFNNIGKRNKLLDEALSQIANT
jgi:hypothetical protein